MAAAALQPPGAKYGPCVDLECGHQDCAFSRLQAAAKCNICGKPIGYDRRFYVVGSPMELSHASCLEDQVEAERRAKVASSQ